MKFSDAMDIRNKILIASIPALIGKFVVKTAVCDNRTSFELNEKQIIESAIKIADTFVVEEIRKGAEEFRNRKEQEHNRKDPA